jgi:hypothetical protein
MIIKSKVAKAAAIAAFGGVTVGGLAVAGALPGISQGQPVVSTPSPSANAGEHPNIGADNGALASAAKSGNAEQRPTPGTAAPATSSDGLTTAQDHVTNPTASTVLEAVSSGTPGPGFGSEVAQAATGTSVPPAATPPVSAPPASVPPVSTPPQAQQGLSHAH